MTRIALFYALTIFTIPILTAQVNPTPFQPPTWSNGQQLQQLQQAQQGQQGQQRRQTTPPIVAQAGPVLGKPLSATETRRTVQTLSDGTAFDTSDVSHFYRDGSGRTREASPVRVEIFDPVGRVEYDLNPARKTYQKSSLSNNASFLVAVFGGTSYTSVHSSSDAGPSTVIKASPTAGTEDLGQQMVNGVLAHGARVTETIPVGALGNNREIRIANERWYSDDLQILVKSTNNDPRFGVNIYELTNIDRSAPDASMFAPPSDYTETTKTH